MNKNKTISFKNPAQLDDPLTELLRSGAKQLLQTAIQSELSTLLEPFAGETTSSGQARVVRNGYLPEREIQTGIGPVSVKVPKLRARSGEPVRFQSLLVPPYVRKAQSLEAALPWLYLKGISAGDMGDALKVLVGESASGLSASTVNKLKSQWIAQYKDWQHTKLHTNHWVYIWADGI